jgi:hypothetical protein
MVGAVLVLVGGIALLHVSGRFVLEGLGTPAPIAPTEYLVIGGVYRYVRNPMYLAVLLTIVGEALVLLQPGLLVHAAVVVVAMASFVYGYDQPTLSADAGELGGAPSAVDQLQADETVRPLSARRNQLKTKDTAAPGWSRIRSARRQMIRSGAA